MGGVVGEIIVVTSPGQGHVHPCMKLCTHLLSKPITQIPTDLLSPSLRFPLPSLKTHSLPSSTSPPVLLCVPDPIRLASNLPLNSKPISPPTTLTPNLPSSTPSSTSRLGGQKRSSKNSTSPSSASSPSARVSPPWSWARGKPRPVSSTQARRSDSFPGYPKKWPLRPPILDEDL